MELNKIFHLFLKWIYRTEIVLHHIKPPYPIIPTKLKNCTDNNANSKKLTVSPTIYSDYNTVIQSTLRNYHVKFLS